MITGIPQMAAAKRDYTLELTDTLGTHSLILSISVLIPPPMLSDLGMQVYTTDTSFSLDFANSAFAGEISSCAPSPQLPAGVSVSPSADKSTCTISGTALAALDDQSYTITAVNPGGKAAQQ